MRILLKAAICCTLLTAIPLGIRAGDATPEAPKIKATWKIPPDLHDFVLTVTNNSDKPVYVSNQLPMNAGTIDPQTQKTPDYAPEVIPEIKELHPCIIFIMRPKPPSNGFAFGTAAGGNYMALVPYTVNPGETKAIPIPIFNNPASDAATCSQAILLLMSGDKVFSKLVFESDGKTWKVKQ